jgi:hypothetical protein
LLEQDFPVGIIAAGLYHGQGPAQNAFQAAQHGLGLGREGPAEDLNRVPGLGLAAYRQANYQQSQKNEKKRFFHYFSSLLKGTDKKFCSWYTLSWRRHPRLIRVISE